MRPIDTGPSGTYNPPATFSWNKGQAPRVWAALSALTGRTTDKMTLTVAESLDIVLGFVVAGNLATANQKTARTAIMARASAVYKTAGPVLLDNIGPFCAYCETYLPGQLDVEHVAPKAPYPTFMLSWENFVLACTACNNIKSNNPERAVVRAYPPPKAVLPEQEYFDRIRRHFNWPDIYPDTFQNLPAVLYLLYSVDGAWYEIAIADSVNLQNNYLRSASESERIVRADVAYGGDVSLDEVVCLRINPSDDHLVSLTGQNADPNLDSVYNRRAFNRTRAWFSIMDALRTCNSTYDQQEFEALWPLIQAMMRNTGFWSSWVRAMSQFRDFNGTTMAEWIYLSPNARDYFPGTHTSDIQLPDIQ